VDISGHQRNRTIHSQHKSGQEKTGMIDGIIFDKDGTLFDFHQSWGGWAAGLISHLSRDPGHARTLGKAIGYDVVAGTFAASSPVIADTAAEIAATLLPHLPDMTITALLTTINDLAASAPMAEAVPLIPFLSGLRARGLKLGPGPSGRTRDRALF
jgi:phosphoglycolate phosphatase